jgi:hypothetical protein
MNKYRFVKSMVSFALIVIAGLALHHSQPARAAAILTVTPITWNVIGLDSNDVTVGPNNFPVGARICNTDLIDAVVNVVSTFVWDTTDQYINLRPESYCTAGNPFPTIPTLAARVYVDVYYEVQITRNSNGYNHTARYHITLSSGLLCLLR